MECLYTNSTKNVVDLLLRTLYLSPPGRTAPVRRILLAFGLELHERLLPELAPVTAVVVAGAVVDPGQVPCDSCVQKAKTEVRWVQI